MPKRDIDVVIEEVRRRIPNVACEQLKVTHAADDDGLWFFDLPEGDRSVQVESPGGSCPFLVENNLDDERQTCATVAETVEAVVSKLNAGLS